MSEVFDVTPDPADRPTPAPARRRVPAVLAAVAVVALVLAGGAVALSAHKSTSHAGSALDKLVPASAIGVVQLNLDAPTVGNLDAFLGHFPGALPAGTTKATLRSYLLTSVFRSTPIDYASDVAPWLGDSAIATMFPDTRGNVVPLVILASTDDAAATAAVGRLNAKHALPFSYEAVPGAVLAAGDSADLATAVAAAKAAALDGSGTYAADLAGLPSGSAVTMWADLGRVATMLKSYEARCPKNQADFGGTLCMEANASGPLSSLTVHGGRVAIGITSADRSAVLTARMLGFKASTAPVVGDLITKLPGDSTAALALGSVTGATSGLNGLSSLTGVEGLFALGLSPFSTGESESSAAFVVSAASGSAEASMAVPSPPAIGATSAAVPTLSAAAVASGASPAVHGYYSVGTPLAASGAAFPASEPPGQAVFVAGQGDEGSGSPLDVVGELSKELKSTTGLTYPADFATLLGSGGAVSLGDIPLSSKQLGDLQIGVRTHPADLAKATALAQKLAARLHQNGLPFTFGIQPAGSDLVMATSKSYASTVAADGNLGAQKQFTAAVGDLSHASFVAYVDLTKLHGVLEADNAPAWVSGAAAVGIAERTDGAAQVLQVTVVTS